MSMSHLVFAPYDPSKRSDVRELFKEYPHKNFQLRSMGACKDRMASYLETTLTEPGVHTICLMNDGCLVGLISLQSLPWMSRHFGMGMYAVKHILVRSEGPLAHARLLRYVIEELPDVDFLDCRIAVDDIYSAHALEICGFRYVGTEIFMGQSLKGTDDLEPASDVIVRPCELSDRQEVLDIVRETHTHNRFVSDPIISEHAAKSLYVKLAKNCFDEKEFRVLVAGDKKKVQGFIMSKINFRFGNLVGLKCGSLDFIGVRSEYRKSGIGAALNRAALKWMVREGALFVGVRTQASNYPALRTCYASGFRVTSTSLHFHRWNRRPKASTKVATLPPMNVFKFAKTLDIDLLRA
jgi:ribosomal protein S18 acetylase RimI-like enzyme